MSTYTWLLPAFFTLCYAVYHRRNSSKLPLPPGPPKWPLLGNLLDIPAERQWEKYLDWSNELNSDIIHLNIAGTSVIVLSSIETVKELFEKRGSLYSDRPRSPMINELMGWDFGIGLMKYGDHWRAHRKMFHETLNVSAARQFQPQERKATHQLLLRILESREQEMVGQFRHMAGALILDITYGIQVRQKHDPYIDLAEEVMHTFSLAVVPGAFLVDTFPLLKHVPDWIPGAGFKRKAKQWRKTTRQLLDLPFAETERRMEMGTAPPSFTSLNLRALRDTAATHPVKGYPELVVKNSAANMYAGGSDTTVGALGSFVLAMLANPGAQTTAQAELDAVLGAGHLPDFADQASLPYVSALVKEVLRWKPVGPLAVPHAISVEDEYQGYRIPAGSIVLVNVWALLHDEAIYPDAHAFKPERFLVDGKLNPAICDPETLAFGFGRRICPGLHLATSSLWLTVASILSTFTITKALDADGNELEPSYEYAAGLIFSPLPFKCTMTPRSPAAVETINTTLDAA
ncbi:cytochrome P450 [Mycena filopes]|nr:cytochrome P450 [Mycena filopes]